MRRKGGRRWGDGVHVTEEQTGRPEGREECVCVSMERRGGDGGEQSGKVINQMLKMPR